MRTDAGHVNNFLRENRMSEQKTTPRWIDDPWSALTTGEADAWRAGWVAGVAAGYDAGFAASAEGWNGEHPGDAPKTDYYRDRRAANTAAMEPPA
jgi:hypothetical protein